ncbi:MAG: 1-acyl-sn-glycerol-3-phosphate acyltransferase [Candidatus Omnitrophica bacterium]|nr:1-acyl-sn-glycerol-3-phosphate acyltransferase [Candidatus Omnitrophota bacterium]
MFRKLAAWIVSGAMWCLIVLLTIAVTPPIFFASVVLGPLDPQRRWAHKIAVFWGTVILNANPYWKLNITGKEKIRRDAPYLLIANHSSMTDILCVYHLGMQFKWIAKAELFRVPFFGWNMSLIGYIRLERGKHASIRETYDLAKQWLRRGMSVLIFPEGTRSRDGRLGEFKNGAFKMAVELGIPILPVVISGTQTALAKGKVVLSDKVSIQMTVLDPVNPAYFSGDFERLKESVRGRMQEELNRAVPSLR